MKKLIVILLFLSNCAYAQEKPSTTDLKLGVGVANLGKGDYKMNRFESEVTKKFTKWLSGSVAVNVGIGYSDYVSLRQVNTLSADLNLFVSPFGNQKKHNFKIGTGFTGIRANITASMGSRAVYNRELDTYEMRETIITETRRTIGFSMIIEHEVSIGKKYLLGAKLMVQPYTTGDILTGANLKFGIKL
jgi:hypothetical protein